MRATIEQAEEFTIQIEYGDRSTAHRDQFPLAWRDLGHGRDHMLAH
jgi:hypothetical protein